MDAEKRIIVDEQAAVTFHSGPGNSRSCVLASFVCQSKEDGQRLQAAIEALIERRAVAELKVAMQYCGLRPGTGDES